MKNIRLPSRLLLLAASLLLAAPALWSCNAETTTQRQIREHQDLLKIIDEDTIHNYLVRNNLLNSATRTSSGLYVVSVIAGQGPPVTTGRQVQVNYTGRFLSNGAHGATYNYPASYGNPGYPAGSIFDNSTDTRATCGCVVYAIGSNIKGPGFDEGLLQMRKGDRKLLLIPSRLGYGPSGIRGGIPTDAALLFDVEVLDVF